MKRIFTLLLALIIGIVSNAQVCTTTGFTTCEAPSAINSDFRNGVQVSGTGSPLTVGAKYKFSNAVPAFNLDAIVSVDAIVNATMQGAANPSIDDDAATNEMNTAASQATLFAPRIAPDQKLSCSDRSGYVEFSIKFYTHYSGTALPVTGSEIALQNLNFLQFDMDGFAVGNNGWFKETGSVKMNAAYPYNYYGATTELNVGGIALGWLLTNGSMTDRQGIARCTELVQRSVYAEPQTGIFFRMGYDYKAPGTGCNIVNLQPTRDYGARAGCFTLRASGPLPVSLINFAASAHAGKATVTWTSLQENNLKAYEVQRSFDGINFEVAGNVVAYNLSTIQQYSFVDDITAFTSKYIYYRIRIVDLDHSMKLSNTVLIKTAELKSSEMSVSPNPSGKNVQVKIKAVRAGAGNITLFDATGKTVLKQQANILTGNNSIAINNMSALSEGYYTIRLVVNDEVFSTKLIIWK